jgi:transposase-like protein
MPRRSELSVEQRRAAVLALLRKEEPGVQLARRLGVSEQTLYRWRDEFLAGGAAALSNGKNGAAGRDRELRELRVQLAERDLVIGELTVANRILKKLSGQSP